MDCGVGTGVGTGIGTGIGTGTGEVTGGSVITPSPPGMVLKSGDKVGEEGVGLGLAGAGLVGDGDGKEGEGVGEGGNVLSGTFTFPISTASGVIVEELKND